MIFEIEIQFDDQGIDFQESALRVFFSGVPEVVQIPYQRYIPYRGGQTHGAKRGHGCNLRRPGRSGPQGALCGRGQHPKPCGIQRRGLRRRARPPPLCPGPYSRISFLCPSCYRFFAASFQSELLRCRWVCVGVLLPWNPVFRFPHFVRGRACDDSFSWEPIQVLSIASRR